MKRLDHGFILPITSFALTLGSMALLTALAAGTGVTANTALAPLGYCMHGDCLSDRPYRPLALVEIYPRSAPFSKSLINPSLAYVYAGETKANTLQANVLPPFDAERIAINVGRLPKISTLDK